jgi:Mg/Co/Ni transporter MgtE
LYFFIAPNTATLAEVVTLALFVPLLIGTGGNTGNQAATTVTRALALQDVTPRDIAKVMGGNVLRVLKAVLPPR